MLPDYRTEIFHNWPKFSRSCRFVMSLYVQFPNSGMLICSKQCRWWRLVRTNLMEVAMDQKHAVEKSWSFVLK